jgi:TP901-1 family phage major tail protein
MAAQKGKDLLIKIDITGTGAYTTFAGLRSSRISFNSETVDITNMASQGGWRELLPSTGIRSASVSGSGVFLDGPTSSMAWMYFFQASLQDYEIIMPGLGVFRGKFQIASMEYAGTYDGEATFDISLTSSGELALLEVML